MKPNQNLEEEKHLIIICGLQMTSGQCGKKFVTKLMKNSHIIGHKNGDFQGIERNVRRSLLYRPKLFLLF